VDLNVFPALVARLSFHVLQFNRVHHSILVFEVPAFIETEAAATELELECLAVLHALLLFNQFILEAFGAERHDAIERFDVVLARLAFSVHLQCFFLLVL